MTIRLSLTTWRLKYQVAAFGAYATLLVEYLNLIFGGIENAAPLAISVLTNGSAIIIAGFGGPDAVPLAVIRIGLTTLFLLWRIVERPEKYTFDGTYAILCSCSHLVYQLIPKPEDDGSEVEGDRHRRESEKKSGDFTVQSHMDNNKGETSIAPYFKRHLVFQFNEILRLDGLMALITISGTAMIYRVFDFDLGLGLVFASNSAAICIALLLLINFARCHGRLVDTKKAIQKLAGIIITLAIFCFIVFRDENVRELIGTIGWWKPALGSAWFLWLFSMVYAPSRFLIHASLFPCTACRQANLGHSLETNVAPCPWEESATLPKLTSNEMDENHHTIVRIKRQKCPDLVDRYWLDNQPWFQISPRCFVIIFATGSCLALAGAYLPHQPAYDTDISIAVTFYLTMLYSFAATGHTPVEDSPEMMSAPLTATFPHWKAALQALLATFVVHLMSVFAVDDTYAPLGMGRFLVSLICTGLMPILLAGISMIQKEPPFKQEIKLCHVERRDLSDSEVYEPASRLEKATDTKSRAGTNGGLAAYISIGRTLDLRVAFMGTSAAIFDLTYSGAQGQIHVTAVVTLFTTFLALFLEACVPLHRDIEPLILCTASVALVDIFSYLDVLNLFGMYPNDLFNTDYPSPVSVSLWYATLFSMIMTNRRMIDQKLQSTMQTERKDYLLLSLRSGNYSWELRNSRVAICLVLAFMSTLFDESWPLGINTTVISLTLYTIIVGFRRLPTVDTDEEERSKPHLAVIAFCAVTTGTVVVLNRRGILDLGDDWTVGSWTAIIAYSLPLMVVQAFCKFQLK